jgi:hypothetical protein
MRLAPQRSSSNSERVTSILRLLKQLGPIHQQIGGRHAKGNVPVEVAAFIAGACWDAHMLVAEKEEQLRNQ